MELPDLPDHKGLPDLSDLKGLPDLPDLPDLLDLPALPALLQPFRGRKVHPVQRVPRELLQP